MGGFPLASRTGYASHRGFEPQITVGVQAGSFRIFKVQIL